MCVNLIPGHTYYEYSVWVLKPGMTSLYIKCQACFTVGMETLAILAVQKAINTVGSNLQFNSVLINKQASGIRI
jgi:hypothetical protein